MIFNCSHCKKQSRVKPSQARDINFCSRKCMYASPLWRKSIAVKKIGVTHTAETKEKLRMYMLGRDRGGYKRACITCKVSFRCNPSDKTVNCSRKCSFKYFSQFKGDKHHSWKGGLTPAYLKDRRGFKYVAWRKSVFERDNYTCQACKQVGGKLQADHVMPFALYPDLRFEVLNGRVLCIPCHKKTPTYLSKIDPFLLFSSK